MNKTFAYMMGLTSALACSSAAMADNATIENALRSRADLSSFYAALVNTGVNHELQEGASYSVFAPTNAAFDKISPQTYPCFYSTACREDVAMIVRRHIVPGSYMISDAVKQRGGLYTIDKHFINVSSQTRDTYAVNGKNVTSINQLSGSILYKLDGVIIKDSELAMLAAPVYADIAYAPQAEQVTTTRVVRGPACNSGDCSDKALQSATTVTRTTATGYVPPTALAPAR